MLLFALVLAVATSDAPSHVAGCQQIEPGDMRSPPPAFRAASVRLSTTPPLTPGESRQLAAVRATNPRIPARDLLFTWSCRHRIEAFVVFDGRLGAGSFGARGPVLVPLLNASSLGPEAYDLNGGGIVERRP